MRLHADIEARKQQAARSQARKKTATPKTTSKSAPTKLAPDDNIVSAAPGAKTNKDLVPAAKAGKRWSEQEISQFVQAQSALRASVVQKHSLSSDALNSQVLNLIDFRRRIRQPKGATPAQSEITAGLESIASSLGRSIGSIQGRLLQLMKNEAALIDSSTPTKTPPSKPSSNPSSSQTALKTPPSEPKPKSSSCAPADPIKNLAPLPEPEREPTFDELGDEQKIVYNAVVGERKNCFFTGAAGSGKSWVLKAIVAGLRSTTFLTTEQDKAKTKGLEVMVCAPTGLAASNVGGVTIHKFAGLGPHDETADVNDLISKTRMRKVFAIRWREIDVLVLDEISMVSADIFEKLDAIARAVRKQPNVPFGGIQLVLCGDFLQLPPVSKDPSSLRFCFEAKNWNACLDLQFQFLKIYRQQNTDLVHALNDLRIGQCSPTTLALMQSRLIDPPVKQAAAPLSKFRSSLCASALHPKPPAAKPAAQELEPSAAKPQGTDGIIPTRLFSHKKNVQEENDAQLAALPGEEVVIHAIDTGKPNYRKTLDKDCRALSHLTLKIGAQVVLIKNLDTASGLANGSRGVVVGFAKDTQSVKPSDKLPIVKFLGKPPRLMTRQPFKVMLGNTPISCRAQVPLALCFSCSIHASQGQSLDLAVMDLANCFEHGQVYVAVSRIRTITGLTLRSFDPSKVKAHPRVLEFQKSLVSGTSPTSLVRNTNAQPKAFNLKALRFLPQSAAMTRPAATPSLPSANAAKPLIQEKRRREPDTTACPISLKKLKL